MRTPGLRALLVLLLLAPSAAAHGDSPTMRDFVSLAPGESKAWEREVHWHRLAGVVDADGPLTLIVEGPDGSTTEVASGQTLRVDHLIACCRDAVWSPHTIRLMNPGDAAVAAELDLALLHDNFAVIAHDSEPGAWWQTLMSLGVIIAVQAWRARLAPLDADPRRWLLVSRTLHAAAWASVVLFAGLGMLRFGSGPLAGTVTATAWAPSDGGFFNTHTYVMAGLMVLWGAALAFWAGARRRSGSPRHHRWDGVAFASGGVLVAVIMAVEFGTWVIPVALGLLPAAGILADSFWPRRGPDARGPRPAPA